MLLKAVCWSRYIVTYLCNSGGGSRGGSCGGNGSALTVDLSLSAVPRDMASLAATVANLARGVKTVGTSRSSGAVTADVAELSTSVAFHCLCLTIPSEVVGSTALVAGGSPGTASEASPEAASVSSARGATCTTSHSWVGAVAGQVTSKAARVATSAGASSTQAEGRAVSLDVAKTLAVVALLSLSGARMGASIRLVAGLLAVVAEPLRRGANFGVVADVAALEAGATRQRRHVAGSSVYIFFDYFSGSFTF